MHQNLKSYQRATFATTKEGFVKKVQNPNFVDFMVLDHQTAVCLYDGLSVKCR